MAITFNSCAHCNDCDDLLTETQRAAQNFMKRARAAAYAPAPVVQPGEYQGPAGLQSVAATPPPRSFGAWVRDAAQSICVGGLRAGGTALGALGGGLVMGGEGLLVGGGTGTLVAPGVGTVGCAGVGTVIGVGTGVVVGGGAGQLGGTGRRRSDCRDERSAGGWRGDSRTDPARRCPDRDVMRVCA